MYALIEGVCVMKHVIQSGHVGHVPSTNVVVEEVLTVKQSAHIGHTMCIPQRDMAIASDGFFAVLTPHLHTVRILSLSSAPR
jgi:hypothetical protein